MGHCFSPVEHLLHPVHLFLLSDLCLLQSRYQLLLLGFQLLDYSLVFLFLDQFVLDPALHLRPVLLHLGLDFLFALAQMLFLLFDYLLLLPLLLHLLSEQFLLKLPLLVL